MADTDAIKLHNLQNPKWEGGNPEGGEDTEISGVVVTNNEAGELLFALTNLKDGLIVSRAVASNELGEVIQIADKTNSTGKIVFASDDAADMVFDDGFTVSLLILFTNGQMTVLVVTQAGV